MVDIVKVKLLKMEEESEKETLQVQKRQEREEQVDSLFKDLKEKHGSSYETPKLRLWARMVASNLHDLDSPPQIPAFTGTASKRKNTDSPSQML